MEGLGTYSQGKIMTERQLKTSCLKWLKLNGPRKLWWYCPTDKFRSGLPDLMMSICGRFMWVEFKTEKGKVARIQEWEHGRLKDSGAIGRVIRTREEFIFFIDENMRRMPWNRQ